MSEIQDAVARTRLRLARERLGIPELEERLRQMKEANKRCRLTGEENLWTDDEIDAVEDDLCQRLHRLPT